MKTWKYVSKVLSQDLIWELLSSDNSKKRENNQKVLEVVYDVIVALQEGCENDEISEWFFYKNKVLENKTPLECIKGSNLNYVHLVNAAKYYVASKQKPVKLNLDNLDERDIEYE